MLAAVKIVQIHCPTNMAGVTDVAKEHRKMDKIWDGGEAGIQSLKNNKVYAKTPL